MRRQNKKHIIYVFCFPKSLKWFLSVIFSIIYKLSFLYKNATFSFLLYSLVFILVTGSSFFPPEECHLQGERHGITSLNYILLPLRRPFQMFKYWPLPHISNKIILHSIISNSSRSKMSFLSQFPYLLEQD